LLYFSLASSADQWLIDGPRYHVRIQELEEINHAPPADIRDEPGASSDRPDPHARVLVPAATTAAVGVMASGTTAAFTAPLQSCKSHHIRSSL